MQPTRIMNGSAMTIAGLAERYDGETRRNIPDLWMKFGPRIPEAEGIGKASYGVSETFMDANGKFTYMAGVQVSDARNLPTGFTVIQIPARRYAVFDYGGHVSQLSDLIMKVLGEWVPASGYQIDGQPGLIEVYSEAFDPGTGRGGMEIRIPIKK
jgi:AraC family transcriptional regulator